MNTKLLAEFFLCTTSHRSTAVAGCTSTVQYSKGAASTRYCTSIWYLLHYLLFTSTRYCKYNYMFSWWCV